MLSSGKVLVGQERSGDDANGVLTMQLNTQSSYGAGTKLAFGDFGRQSMNGCNVFVGEYGLTDTDQLWLHGKKGIYLTVGKSDTNIAYYTTDSDRFNFNCDVWSKGQIVLTSDKRLKENIQPLGQTMSKLQNLNGVSYNYLQSEPSATQSSVGVMSMDETELSEKEQKDQAYFEAYEQRKNKTKRIGLIAQEMLEVYPELVVEDSAGYYAVDYIGLIPVIIEELKEQQAVIDAQSVKLKELDAKLAAIDSLTETANSPVDDSNSMLYQNTPNPFEFSTEIKYFIAENFNYAAITICDLQGNELKRYTDLQVGNGTITVDAFNFKKGVYNYTLIIDGKQVDSKKMLVK